MKKIISIVSVLGLFLTKSVNADVINPGPIWKFADSIGFEKEYLIIRTLIKYIIPILFVVVIIYIALFITRKIEKKIKEKKNKDNIILK